VWEDNDMKTMKEFLKWYNNKDVEPMWEASDNMLQFNQKRRIELQLLCLGNMKLLFCFTVCLIL
jgi:hypothetical protein